MKVGALLLVMAACGGTAAPSATPQPPADTPAVVLPPLPMPTDPASYREVRVADGVYAFIAPSNTPVVSGNSLVVIGADAVLVVDTQQFPTVARWEIERIKALTDKPVRYIVNTHWHNDHWLGNADFVAAWPDAVVLATESTRQLAATRGVGFLDPAEPRQQLADARAMLAGKPGDPPLSANRRTFLTIAIEELVAYIDEIATVRPLPPTTTFQDAVVLDLGGRTVEVRFLGRGNTAGDAIAWLPDARVVATGDLVVSPVPFATGPFVGEWIETLAKVDALDAAVVVPGHGDVMRDERFLDHLQEALRRLMAQARAAVAAGTTLEAAQAAVDLGDLPAAMCGDDPWCQVTFAPTFTSSAFARAYREAAEGPLTSED